MNRRTLTWCALAPLVLGGLFIGCAATPETGRSTAEIATVEYGRMYQAAVDVLKEEGLEIAEADYRFGRVTSAPWTVATVAEPWRRPTGTARQALQGTLNNQRRFAVVSIEPADAAETGRADPRLAQAPDGAGPLRGEYAVRVQVTIEQLQVPKRYLTGSTAGRRVFGQLRAVPTEWAQRGITGAYWSAVGRDPILEQHLLEAIIRRSVAVQSPRRGDAAPPTPPDATEPAPTDELPDE